MPYKDKEESRVYQRNYDRVHRDKARLECRGYYQRHIQRQRQKARERMRKYRENNLEVARQKGKAYYERNRERIARMHLLRTRKHPEYAIMNHAVHNMLGGKISKKAKCIQYIGCSPGFLRNHLESLFKPGMTWENYGSWNVDHIVPLSWFPFDEDPLLLFVASHWTNLRPMWELENKSKGNRYSEAVA